MKTHAIIPIFIPHKGCPNDCVFCNQKKITAKQKPFEVADIEKRMEEYLPTLKNRGLEVIEVAFFGGSFTGIPLEEQKEYLRVAKRYKDAGEIQKIHLSTRPDYIDDDILKLLKDYTVDVIELGVQSFDAEVLKLSNRGHTRDAVYPACKKIKEYGFELGIQLMIGLPGDTYEKCMKSVQEAVKIGPSLARLYPTVIIKDTELFEQYQRGEFQPFSKDEILRTTKDMYRVLRDSGITILRVGLKSSDLICETGETAGGTYHPAFRQLVEGELAKEDMEKQLLHWCNRFEKAKTEIAEKKHKVTFLCEGTSFSNMIGNCRRNKLYFEEKYSNFSFRFKTDETMEVGKYYIKLS